MILKRTSLLVMRWGYRLEDGKGCCRCSKWPLLIATEAVKHLVKFATALLMCSCGSSFQIVCRRLSTRQSYQSSAEVCGTFPAPGAIVELVQIWRVWGPLIIVNKPGTVCLPPVLSSCDECRVCCKSGVVVIKTVQICHFQIYILPKLGGW